jgi:putative SOS response-associated peptidase YedK
LKGGQTSLGGSVPIARRKKIPNLPRCGLVQTSAAVRPFRSSFASASRTGQPFAFGGVWDAWKDPATEDWLQSFSIITTDPNELTATVHDRMPVILKPSDYDRWFERADTDATSG